MANCVRRSNALLRYSSSLTYSEARVFPGLMAACVDYIQGRAPAVQIATFYFPPFTLVAVQVSL
jgi:hypothetical protein